MNAPIPHPTALDHTPGPAAGLRRGRRPLALTALAVLDLLFNAAIWWRAQAGVDVSTVTVRSAAESLAIPALHGLWIFLLCRGFEWARIVQIIWSAMMVFASSLAIAAVALKVAAEIEHFPKDTVYLPHRIALSVLWLVYLSTRQLKAFTRGIPADAG